MAKPQLRQSISDALHRIGEANDADALSHSATHLLSVLGYASQKTLNLPTQPHAFATELGRLLASASPLDAARASLNDWRSVSFLFQLTDDELPALAAGQQSFFVGGGMQPHQIESFVFLAIDLADAAWSRSRLAQITRELNRLFPMPAVLLFRHSDANGQAQMSVAVIHRRANKRDATRDVIENKVSIIKDVNLQEPHAAHLRILESLALSEVDDKFVPASFDALYKAWLNVLDVKMLNDRFYKDLADWYYWAVLASTGVTFPRGQPLEDSTDPATKGRPTVAMIRLLTRLIFVWFLKEKGLIPAALFDGKKLATLLVDAPDADGNGSAGNYYQAILQNLFFATLNTETTDEDESGNKQRVWREAAGPKRLEKYLIHTVYRYKSAFKDPDAAIALFRRVPFLNGGLFECLDKLVTPADLARNPDLKDLVVVEGKQTVLRVDGFSERSENPLHIPNEIFFSDGQEVPELNTVFDTKNRKYKPRGLLKIFGSYKFTIEENTPIEEEVALDPELLGKVFENLLASYNPDTKTTARKKSGSFYTPREVVDYMVDEALVAHLERSFVVADAHATSTIKRKLASRAINQVLDLGAGAGDLDFESGEPSSHATASPEDIARKEPPIIARLRHALSYRRTGHDFSAQETQNIIAAIEQLRVLDPACGSGAFPMGMLQKLVHLLRKLDPDNALWKAQNRAPLMEQLAAAKKLKDPTLKDEQITATQAALERFDADFADPEYADYARKLYLIEKCLYGVDIQPIAVQIAKLRFFISLVVEQRLGTDHQRITPLPNLETKIVAANTLLLIPRGGNQASLLANPEVAEKEAELREANASHFAAKRFADKRRRKERILRLRDELAKLLEDDGLVTPGDADVMSAWDPFDQNRHAEFFDPEWMFGFSRGFDVVIGNPPYVRQEAIKEQKPKLKPHYKCYSGTADLYVYFYERSFQLLNPHGVLSFITSNKWFRAKYGELLRGYMATHTTLRQIIDFGDEAVFDALAYPTIVIATKRERALAISDVRNDVLALNWDSTNEAHTVDAFPDVFASERFEVPQHELKADGWQLESPTKRRLLLRVRSTGVPLRKYSGAHVYRGITTGFNSAFVLTAEDVATLVDGNAASVDLIKPYLRGQDVTRWEAPQNSRYVIQIESSENAQHPWSGLGEEDAERVFKATHPRIYDFMMRYRSELIDRYDQGRYFWELRACRYWDDFLAPKILSTKVSIEPTFCLDETGSVLGNTSYFFAAAKTPLYIMALLNSSVSAFFSRNVFVAKQGGFYEVQPDALEQFPVPEASAHNTSQVITIVRLILQRKSDREFERLLNGLVYELFFPDDLHAKNIRLFDACAAAGVSEGMDAAAIAAKIFHPSHTIYGMLFDLQSVEAVRIIEGLD